MFDLCNVLKECKTSTEHHLPVYLAAFSPQKEGHAACMNEMKMHKKFQSGKYDFGPLSVDWRIIQSSILQEQDIQRYGLIKQAQDSVLCYDLVKIVLHTV